MQKNCTTCDSLKHNYDVCLQAFALSKSIDHLMEIGVNPYITAKDRLDTLYIITKDRLEVISSILTTRETGESSHSQQLMPLFSLLQLH